MFLDAKGNNYLSNHEKFFSNFVNTEIDVVIETPSHFLIGENKSEMSFGANSKDCFVHQLIRQYAMAKVLLKLVNCEKQLIPFVIGDNVIKSGQVTLMEDLGLLNKKNVFSWNDIKIISNI